MVIWPHRVTTDVPLGRAVPTGLLDGCHPTADWALSIVLFGPAHRGRPEQHPLKDRSLCRLMVTINLHACEATTQETVGRGSSIDLHVCGASVCVCPRQPSRAPRCASSLRSTRVTNAPRSQLLPITRYGVCGATAHAWPHRARVLAAPAVRYWGPCRCCAVQYGVVRYW